MRCTSEQAELWARAAGREVISLSDWMRKSLDVACKIRPRMSGRMVGLFAEKDRLALMRDLKNRGDK